MKNTPKSDQNQVPHRNLTHVDIKLENDSKSLSPDLILAGRSYSLKAIKYKDISTKVYATQIDGQWQALSICSNLVSKKVQTLKIEGENIIQVSFTCGNTVYISENGELIRKFRQILNVACGTILEKDTMTKDIIWIHENGNRVTIWEASGVDPNKNTGYLLYVTESRTEKGGLIFEDVAWNTLTSAPIISTDPKKMRPTDIVRSIADSVSGKL